MENHISLRRLLAKEDEDRIEHRNSKHKQSRLHDQTTELLGYTANCYKQAEAWDKAKEMYIKLAMHHLKTENRHEAAFAAAAFVDAARCCNIGDGKFNGDKNVYVEIFGAVVLFEKASELFQKENLFHSMIECCDEAAQLALQIEKYPKAIEIYENLASYLQKKKILEHKVKGYLFKAGICRLCRGDDVVVMAKQYADLYPNFGDTLGCKFLESIADSVEKCNITMFRNAVEKFKRMAPPDSLAITLLKTVEEKVKALENIADSVEKCNLIMIRRAVKELKSVTPPDEWMTSLLSRVEERMRAKMSRRTRRSTKALDLVSMKTAVSV